jgi:hypothetical protein
MEEGEKGVTDRAQNDENYPIAASSWSFESLRLLVEIWAKNSDGEVLEVDRAFVELQPANDTVVAEVFGDASFRDAEVIGEQRLEVGVAAAGHTRTGEAADGDAQRVTGFDVVIGGHIVVGENENARANRSVGSIVEFSWRTCEQAAKLHFEKRETRSQAGITEAAFDAGGSGLGNLFDGNARNGTAVHHTGRENFGGLGLRRRFGVTRARGGAVGYAGFSDRRRGSGFAAIATATATAAPVFFVRG